MPHGVLLVAHAFPPTGGTSAQRLFKLARYLPQFDWVPAVLTTKDENTLTLDPDLLKELPDVVKVIRVRDPLTWWRGVLRKPDTRHLGNNNGTTSAQVFLQHPSLVVSMKNRVRQVGKSVYRQVRQHLLVPDEALLFSLVAVSTALRLVRAERIDCIYTMSGPQSTHLVGFIVHRLTGLPWVADFCDPRIGDGATQVRGLCKYIERWIESRVFTHASEVVTVTNAFRKEYEKKYPTWSGRIRVIRNGVDPADFPTVYGLPKPGPFVLVYAGIQSPTRSLKVFLQALSTVLRYHRINEREIRVLFAGVFDCPDSNENRQLVRTLGLDNVVEELGYLPRKRVLEFMQTADGLLLIGDVASQASQYIPGKLYEYLYTKRPILALLREGEAADLIRQLGAGVVVNPQDVQAIASQIVSWVRQKRRGNWQLSDMTSDNHRLTSFTRLGQAADLARILDELYPEERIGRMTGNL